MVRKKSTSTKKTPSASRTMGEKIYYLRRRLDLTQTELAKRAKLSQSVIAELESGRHDPTLSTLEKVAAGLEVTLAIFFSSDEVLVFDMKKLEKNYKSVSSLNETISHALLKVTHYAKMIGYIK